jgi:hypothetical protein
MRLERTSYEIYSIYFWFSQIRIINDIFVTDLEPTKKVNLY